MTVRLIEEAPGAVSHSRDLADGSTITVRRRVDGTDVFITPPDAEEFATTRWIAPSIDQAGYTSKVRKAMDDAYAATHDRRRYRDLQSTPFSRGARVTGIEVAETTQDLLYAADLSEDGCTVLLITGAGEWPLPPAAARHLAAALVAMSDKADPTGAAPAPEPSERTDDRVSVASAWDAEGRTVEWRFLTPEEAKAMDANKAARDAEATEKLARDRAFTEAFERITAQGIRDAMEVNSSALSGQRFPLDAEQIVRLTGAVLTRVLNASRPADSRAVGEEGLILALGEAVGVPLLVERNQFGILELQPYGRKASASQADGEA